MTPKPKEYTLKELNLNKSQYKKYKEYMGIKGVGSALAVNASRGHKPSLNFIGLGRK